MNLPSLLQYGVFLLVVIALVKPLGGDLTRVFEGKRTWLDFLLRPVERLIYKLTGIDQKVEMTWKQYAVSFVLFSLAGTVSLYLILRLQYLLPFYDAAHLTTPLAPDLAMNTAVSFSTTTWQAYAGETTMSYVSQLAGLAAQNFLAGAAGLGVGVAFIRGLAREQTDKIGNFWVDLVRGLLWILLALAGSFARQRRRPTTLGSLPAYTLSFGVLVVATALIVGGLSYFPALTLGPLLEHLLLHG